MNKIEDIFRNNKELLYATINHYRKQINLDEAYDKHIKYQLKQYLLQEVSNFGEKGYTSLDNKKLLDILHPNQDNKVSDMDYINIRRIADILNIKSTSKYQNIDYKKGIYLTKDISIGLYEIPSCNDSYSKLVAYFITPYDNINFKIVANLWETENLWKMEGGN